MSHENEVPDGRDSVEAFSGGHGDASPPDKNNLPFELTSFVGRAREISKVKELLSEKTRLVTLTGPGGSGKTRLALAVAADVVEEYAGGVWLVELAPLSDPRLVPQALASVLGVREMPNRPLLETLVDHLKPKSALLVVDNCEHLVGACASLAEALLRRCPNLSILATSREPLGAPGEFLVAVPPLSLPDPRHLPAVESLPRYEATRLFVERARAVKHDFTLTERNAMAVAQICYRLDGIPLAVELAAARARVLSVEQISSRLDDRLGLLTGGGRKALPHQRTLRATMDWSHGLLSEEEKVLFRRLSVFSGGFTLSAAEAGCAERGSAGEYLEPSELLDLLSHLVDKSLVLVAEGQQQGGEARYRMLETIRQYGLEKLIESGEESALRRLHADFFLQVAERVEPKINTRDRKLWLERLEVEHANLRAALTFSRAHQTQSETGLRLAGALFWFWFHRGYFSEGRRWLGAALGNEEGLGRRAVASAPRAKALCGAGLMAWLQDDHGVARSHLEESVALWRQLGDKGGLAQSLRVLSHAVLGRVEPAVARSMAEESVQLFRQEKDEFGLATSLATLGLVALSQEDYEAAWSFFEESVAICRQSGDDWALALALRNLGIWAIKRGDYEEAAVRLRESLIAHQEPGDVLYMVTLDLLAAAISMQGEHWRAARLFGLAEALREAVGASVVASVRADYDRGVAAARSALGDAAFAAAWSEGRAITPEEAVEYTLKSPETPEEAASPPVYPGGLSAREVEVLRLVAKGMTNAQVAKELFISPRTVNWHLNSIYRKLGFSSRAEATRFALEHNLL